MSKESGNANSGGIGAIGLLGVVFVTLKLLGIGEVATWSWVWVLAPFWIGIAIFLAVFLIYLAIVAIIAVCSK